MLIRLTTAALLLSLPAIATEMRTKMQEHVVETPAARENARVQHRKGQPDRIDKSPGGAYAPSDTASSSGKPPDATPKR